MARQEDVNDRGAARRALAKKTHRAGCGCWTCSPIGYGRAAKPQQRRVVEAKVVADTSDPDEDVSDDDSDDDDHLMADLRRGGLLSVDG